MGIVALICGKICYGKTTYAKALASEKNAVILSVDEATYDLLQNEQGEFFNVFVRRTQLYLMKKAAEIARAGADVILDWGFWTKADRQEISDYLRSRGIGFEWHYLDIPDSVWQARIEARNAAVLEGRGGSDFYVDEGLWEKLLGLFEAPDRDEMDFWIGA